jgi:transposase-like protein
MAQLRRVAEGLRGRFPQAAELLEEAAEDILAHLHFPEEHRRRLHSTDPLERLHEEVKRRTHVVGIVPDRRALLRLVGMLLVEQDDEWAVADRRYFSLESMRKLYQPEGGKASAGLVAAVA